MVRGDVEEYLGRDWQESEDSKRRWWAERYLAEGPSVTLKASQALYVHMKSVRPDWPTEAERAEDYAHHLRLKALLDAVADAFPAR